MLQRAKILYTIVRFHDMTLMGMRIRCPQTFVDIDINTLPMWCIFHSESLAYSRCVVLVCLTVIWTEPGVNPITVLHVCFAWTANRSMYLSYLKRWKISSLHFSVTDYSIFFFSRFVTRFDWLLSVIWFRLRSLEQIAKQSYFLPFLFYASCITQTFHALLCELVTAFVSCFVRVFEGAMRKAEGWVTLQQSVWSGNI